jgi:hypothetical protein
MGDIEKSVIVEESSPQPNDDDIYIDPEKERRLLWKCDIFLTSLLTLAFLSAYLDRSNIGNAAVAGMLTDLNMSRQDFASKLIDVYLVVSLTRDRCCSDVLCDLCALRVARFTARQEDSPKQTAPNIHVSSI